MLPQAVEDPGQGVRSASAHEPVRREAHVQWSRQQVLLVRIAERLTLVCPGVDMEVEPALECLRRLAKAVGAPSSRYTAAIRL